MNRTIRPRALSGKTTPELWPWEQSHRELAREAAGEGIVLLKNDGLLPLKKNSKIALFGSGASRTIKGGTGSGDVNERYSVTLQEGLKDAGFILTTEDWIKDFEDQYMQAKYAWRDEIMDKFRKRGDPRAFFAVYSTTPFVVPVGGPAVKTDTDTAIFILSRVAGEGADRQRGEGDYVLRPQEHDLLAGICGLYENVIVIVNAGGAVDLSFMDEFKNIKALLFVSQAGMEGGRAIADVLDGTVNPSGHLTDTWAFHYDDYPTAATFSHNNGDVENERYAEGIYVGYRYFDSFGIPARYGFGDGLSYTEFAYALKTVKADPEGKVCAEVTVTNTGKVPGKAVAQLYAQLPFGKLEKETRRLVAYGKTDLLASGASQTLTLCFTASDLASFDEAASAYVLEPGVYGLWLGDSLNGSALCAALNLKENVCLKKVDHICPLKEELKELKQDADKAKARYDALLEKVTHVTYLDYTAASLPDADYTEPKPDAEAAALTATLSQEELIALAIGDPSRGQGSELGSAGISVPGAAGETSAIALAKGVAPIVLADGPAGLRLTKEYSVIDGKPQKQPFLSSVANRFFAEGKELEGEIRYQYCSAWPVGTLLAQTWNLPLVTKVGDAVGKEMEDYNVTLWLAPGMNIHRDPLCGRNFEYFSEDPLVSGYNAAAMTLGVQKHKGCGTTIKHFACNNQEDNRMASNSIVSEKALREIYLRGFQIAIQLSHPLSIMTSYNLVNGVHAANCYDLCTKYARCESGFDGVIMTDWTTTNKGDPLSTAAGCMRAGNDLVMPGMDNDFDSIRDALADGSLSIERLRECVAHLVRVVLLSGWYEA